jgi:hypothetical protein
MKLINQLLILAFIVITITGCEGQSNSKGNDIKTDISLNDVPLEIPERLKKIDRVSKQIYKLLRELRDLRIEEFIDDVNQSCESLENFEIEFILDQESGKLIEYLVNGEKNEIDCIEERLIRVHRNFGEMSFGYTNAFQIRPTRRFVIIPNKVKK